LANSGRSLADFALGASVVLLGHWTWGEGGVSWRDQALHVSPIQQGGGAVSWRLDDGRAVDLSLFGKERWKVKAMVVSGNEPGTLLLTLIDVLGKERSWRLKAESFFEDKLREHVHFLTLGEADFRNPSAGFGPKLETAGFDLTKVVSAKLEPDPESPPPGDGAWVIRRIGL
jgi:hypothetical protein